MPDKKLHYLGSIKNLVSRIKCGDFKFVVDEYKGAPFLQIVFDAPDTNTGDIEPQYCRKWTLQYAMCDSEIVRTAYKAALAAFEHECQEQFRFCNEAIFSPHTDVHQLVMMRKSFGYMEDTREEDIINE